MANLVQAKIRMPSSHESAPVSTVGWAKNEGSAAKAGNRQQSLREGGSESRADGLIKDHPIYKE
jgi:hypothetical protein